jgi:hypothetical protein
MLHGGIRKRPKTRFIRAPRSIDAVQPSTVADAGEDHAFLRDLGQGADANTRFTLMIFERLLAQEKTVDGLLERCDSLEAENRRLKDSELEMPEPDVFIFGPICNYHINFRVHAADTNVDLDAFSLEVATALSDKFKPLDLMVRREGSNIVLLLALYDQSRAWVPAVANRVSKAARKMELPRATRVTSVNATSLDASDFDTRLSLLQALPDVKTITVNAEGTITFA